MTAFTNSRLASPAWFNNTIARQAIKATILLGGASIHYRTWGSGGRPLILIHGGAAHSHWWDHIAPLLTDGHKVIAFDLSGHGDSSHRAHYSVETWAAEALGIAQLSPRQAPIVIGHSLGGVVALQAAMNCGASLGGVIIVDSPLVNFTPEEDAAADRLAFGPPRLYPSREALAGRFRPVPEQQTLDYVVEHIANHSVRELPGGWGWKFDPRIFDRAPELPNLAPLPCRTALFRGEHGMVGTAMAGAIYRKLGSTTAMIELPDAGHHPMLDQPVALAASLRTLLASWEA